MKQNFREKKFGALALGLLMGLAACQADGPVERGGDIGFVSNSADCGAVDLQYLIGQPLSVFEAVGHKGTPGSFVRAMRSPWITVLIA